MTKCEICNRETRAGYLWCDDCVAKWNDTPDTSLFIKWAMDRAREVEQEKNKSLLKEIERLQERLRRTAQILIEEVGADGPKDAEEAAEKAVGRLRANTTAEQERESIVEWLSAQAKTYNFSDQRSLVKDLAYRIKNGEFGLKDGNSK